MTPMVCVPDSRIYLPQQQSTGRVIRLLLLYRRVVLLFADDMPALNRNPEPS